MYSIFLGEKLRFWRFAKFSQRRNIFRYETTHRGRFYFGSLLFLTSKLDVDEIRGLDVNLKWLKCGNNSYNESGFHTKFICLTSLLTIFSRDPWSLIRFNVNELMSHQKMTNLHNYVNILFFLRKNLIWQIKWLRTFHISYESEIG